MFVWIYKEGLSQKDQLKFLHYKVSLMFSSLLANWNFLWGKKNSYCYPILFSCSYMLNPNRLVGLRERATDLKWLQWRLQWCFILIHQILGDSQSTCSVQVSSSRKITTMSLHSVHHCATVAHCPELIPLHLLFFYCSRLLFVIPCCVFFHSSF